MRNIVALCILLFIACHKDYSVVASGRVEVKSKPSPFEDSNDVVVVLDEGDPLTVLSSEYGKDFIVYEVDAKGKRGYVFSGDRIIGLRLP